MNNQIKFIIIFLLGLVYAQGNLQILTIPSNTKLLSLANAGHALDNYSMSCNPASISLEQNGNINLHSHLYPGKILYLNTEIIIPRNNYIYSFNYANLNYGDFKDGISKETFNSSEFLFRGSIKTHIFNKISIGGSLGYGINKISNEFSHALLISLGARTQSKNPSLGIGFSINNLGAVVKHFSNIDEPIPTSINLSTYYSPKYFPGVLLFDLFQYSYANNIQIHAGVEIKLSNYLFLRLGNNSNALNFSDSYSSYFPGLSGGIGIQTKNWDVDVGCFNLETAGVTTAISLLYKK